MSISNFRVLGGEKNYSGMTSELAKDEAAYAGVKAFAWFDMLKGKMKPIRWYKPTKKGTRVKFEMIASQEIYDTSYGEFEGYLKHINEKYSLGLEVTSDQRAV
ncbi:hypothetical protein [Brevibacillus brevis]|uniref:hypothetical protein n=1 Tax=Brevibacillus brevis TaxID=1393 RepID=UPI000D0ECA3D|nr:hypothetical protein [Brevibacillus brevis]PSJ63494.1 hypothetical protein C7J99_31510 [Brevibacillus brevis]RED21256.1 hypothetical protein DES34_12294 [Brevibacillus brevis]VEF87611.1 Uncharacterised protein [Brevibacillus brevis]VEF90157.1 Uncharacterised protein [Brevibacillus brevis]GEC93802.1 hypothetical protein BBR01nite_61330 [Brevibacillus brevis]